MSESLDTATPARRMVFTVLGAVAELERSLIAKRVRPVCGMRRQRVSVLGRPPVVDVSRVHALRASGLSWKRIASKMGVGLALSIGLFLALPITGKWNYEEG